MASTPSQTSPRPLPRLPRWCVGAIVLIWLATAVGFKTLQVSMVDAPRQASVKAMLTKEATTYSERLESYLDSLLMRTDEIASLEQTANVLALPKRTPSDWIKRARVLETLTPQRSWFYEAKSVLREADNLYLINPARDSFPLEGNFVARLLYDAALRGEQPPPRAAKTEGWFIYIARPVHREGELQGVLIAKISPDEMKLPIAGEADLKGQIQLTQKVANFAATTFLTFGTGWKEEYSTTVATQINEWQLKFTASREAVSEAEPTPALFYLAMALVFGAAAALSALLVRKNLYYPEIKRSSRRKIDPKDDLFTEKHMREATSFLDPAPAARQATPAASATGTTTETEAPSNNFPEHVFRDYDIRGKAEAELTRDFATTLGKLLGTMVLARGENKLVVCADGRKSSPMLKTALGSGILSTGCDLVDIGEAPTPLMNFTLATARDCVSGVMVTASHNSREDNGFKIILDNRVMSSEGIKELRAAMLKGDFASGNGEIEHRDLHQSYINGIADDVLPPAKLKVVIDCGNGIAGVIAPSLFKKLGCEVTELYTDVDGDFPHHDPDPTVKANLRDLINLVTEGGHDLGLAFDGDGDRVVAVTASGRIVWPDELLMIFARDIVTRHPGADIVFDVKSTRRLRELVSSYGGRPLMWKTGHAHMRNKVRETGAPVGGEYSGHLFFSDRWYGFDDGLYAAARLLEIITLREQSLDDIIASFPDVFSSDEIKVPVAEEDKLGIINKFIETGDFDDAHVVTIDGLRVEYSEGWGLIRASNTTAALTLRFEADSQESLDHIQAIFREKLQTVAPDLKLPF